MVVRLFIIIILCTSCITSEIDVDILGEGASSIPQGNLSIVDNKLKLTLNELSGHDITEANLKFNQKTYDLTVEDKGGGVYMFSPLANVEIKSSTKFVFKYKMSDKWYLLEKVPGIPKEIQVSALKGESGFKHLSSEANTPSWQRRFIEDDLTINVPADFSDLISVLNYLKNKKIYSDATVTIKIADGTYNYSQTVYFNHHQNSRIKIVGNITNPENVILDFAAEVDGFHFSKGNSFQGVLGLTLRGQDNNNTVGITVTSGTSAKLYKVNIQDFGRGLYIDRNSSLEASEIQSTSNVQSGMVVNSHSSATASNSSFSNNGADGVYSALGSSANVDRSTLNNNSDQGLESWVNSWGVNWGGSATGNSNDYTNSSNSRTEF